LGAVPVPLTPEYGGLVDQVQAILKRNFRTRVYKWLHQLTTADIKISVNGKITASVTSLSGIAVLKVLARSPVIPVLELAAQSGVSREALQKLMQCFRQEGLVTIASDSGQTVTLNQKWVKPGKQKPILTENWTPIIFEARPIGENRSQATRACIVRIMKHTRMMRYQQLIEKTIEAGSVIFPIKVSDVKFEIQYLIRSHYMEQVDDEHVEYVE
jgi:DNA-binding transcriptional regulator YhcF (GntR family)